MGKVRTGKKHLSANILLTVLFVKNLFQMNVEESCRTILHAASWKDCVDVNGDEVRGDF